MSETIAGIVAANRADASSISGFVRRTFERIHAANDPALFIHLRSEAEVQSEASALATTGDRSLPLFGVPVAIKDNIDVAGMPTTAACPNFSYQPTVDAAAVARLRRAGALVIGKTNLDQFATGLVGVRSPYGIPRNAMKPDLVPGGSSSGSAVAVARGIVPLALGTDTAGSGRVPAGLNNVVGLKPSLGLLPASGVVPACRSLDCISVFALTAEDAFTALEVMAGADPLDAYSRTFHLGPFDSNVPASRLAVPRRQDRAFFGDARAEAAFDAALDAVHQLGWTTVEIDLSPFLETARLLYEGAWIAERTAAVGDFIAKHPDAIHPVTKAIIVPGAKLSAVDAFRGFYRLAALRRQAHASLAGTDALMVPTAPAAYTLADLEADPIGPNSRLGTYTNFVNLLDMAGIAVPAAIAGDGTPYGVTFLGAAGSDGLLASIGSVFHRATGLALGATGATHPPAQPGRPGVRVDEIAIAVVGAHLSGMPLNNELTDLGGRLLEATSTADDYRLFALANTKPAKPGLLRVAQGAGAAIAVEVWALPVEGFGHFVGKVPAPLSIGTLRLNDGRSVKGFLVEPEGIIGARDVSEFGGWRAAVAAMQ